MKNISILIYSLLVFLVMIVLSSCEGPSAIEQNIYLEDTLFVTEYDTIYQEVEVFIRDTFRVREQPLSWQIFYGAVDAEKMMFIDTIQLNYTESVLRFTVERPLQYSGSDDFEISIDSSRLIETNSTPDGVILYLPFIIEYGNSTINQVIEVILRFEDLLTNNTAEYTLNGITYLLNTEYEIQDTFWYATPKLYRGTIDNSENFGNISITRTSFSTTENNSQDIITQYEMSGNMSFSVIGMYNLDSIIFNNKESVGVTDSYFPDNFFDQIDGQFEAVSPTKINHSVDNILQFSSRLVETNYQNIYKEITYQHGAIAADNLPNSFILNIYLAKEDPELTSSFQLNFVERQDIILRLNYIRL